MQVTGLCPAGSELVYFLRELRRLWTVISEKKSEMYFIIILHRTQSSSKRPTLLKTRGAVVPAVYVLLHW